MTETFLFNENVARPLVLEPMQTWHRNLTHVCKSVTVKEDGPEINFVKSEVGFLNRSNNALSQRGACGDAGQFINLSKKNGVAS